MAAESHRRFNPLRQEWVIVSPQRRDRPWQGQVEPLQRPDLVRHDPDCYLCPGNHRAHGVRNPDYQATFSFDNDFPALVPGPAVVDIDRPPTPPIDDLLQATSERGICRVICFSPRHDLTLARMDVPSVRRVVDTWVDECTRAATNPWVKYTLVFENRGEMMGASNPHPHCQLWATEHVPNEPAREWQAFEAYRRSHNGACLLCDYLTLEINQSERVIFENDTFVGLVPFWATWPFEALLVSRRHMQTFGGLTSAERDGLANALTRLAAQYDALFDSPFPYSAGFHPAPVNDSSDDAWHFHAHFYPPLLRSATIRKFMVGFELLGSPQRDLTPEEAARWLREHTR
jgi:UDPglucose--hexose-1-phosphate uridylyltransferase